jgi:hypothetical protein
VVSSKAADGFTESNMVKDTLSRTGTSKIPCGKVAPAGMGSPYVLGVMREICEKIGSGAGGLLVTFGSMPATHEVAATDSEKSSQGLNQSCSMGSGWGTLSEPLNE